MINLNKIVALLSSSVLLYLSATFENYSLLITTNILHNECDNLNSHLPIDNPNLYFPYRQGDRFLTSIKNLPVSNLKNYPNDLYTNSLSPEIRILSSSSQYLIYSEIIYLSLANRDIIYPFHYFW